MKHLSTALTAVALGLAAQQGHAGDYNFKPGLWETTTTSEIQGVPPDIAAMMQQPPQTQQSCVSEDDLEFGAGNECRYTNKRISASKLLVDVQCTTPVGVTQGKGEVNLKGERASGWFEMAVPEGPMGPMKMRSVFQSKYIGVCK